MLVAMTTSTHNTFTWRDVTGRGRWFIAETRVDGTLVEATVCGRYWSVKVDGRLVGKGMIDAPYPFRSGAEAVANAEAARVEAEPVFRSEVAALS